jgi:hypothetical protein
MKTLKTYMKMLKALVNGKLKKANKLRNKLIKLELKEK